MAERHHYRRVLVMVRAGHAEAPPFRLAAELAHLLELELEGIFLEDEALFSLSQLPFARELRLPGHTWQALDPAQMLEDFRNSAGQARRLLAEAAARLGVASSFAVLRGDPRGALTEHTRPEDILVLAESGAERAATIRTLSGEAFGNRRSGLLLVPARPAERRHGIALLLPAAGANVVEVAVAIARASGEDMVLIVPEDARSSEARVGAALREAGMPPGRIGQRRVRGRDAGQIARALRATGARIVVWDRTGFGADVRDFLARLLAEGGAAVLLLGEVPASGSAA